ncbi:MAG: endolytic transglycosylase MltG [Oscillospiraceae bacterium]|nr:endolytic transglycosylase MltG [Oscillospiraceae bacterium]
MNDMESWPPKIPQRRREGGDDASYAETRRVSPAPRAGGENAAPPTPAAVEEDLGLEERDFRPVRMSRSGRIGCLGGIMYAVFIVSVSVILACVCWLAACDVMALNKDEGTATVYLPEAIFTMEDQEVKDGEGNVTGTRKVRTADIDYVADVLKDAGIIQYKPLFKLFARISHASTKLDPGTYVLTTEMDYRALVKNMQVGTASMVVTTLTFPEGMTMDQIFGKLEEEGICSKSDLYDAAANFNYSFRFLEDAETGDAKRLEGFIFPNTYDFYQGEQASSVINKFLSALHTRITADMWTQIENRGTTFRNTVIIASMIEKEAANDGERAAIASVIYNRLAAEMPLGIDSTILYEYPDYDGGVDLPAEIREADSPYNTQLYPGLPPTPICNPGMASIDAALHPANTGNYYYALDTATGEHRFFTNYNDFYNFIVTQDYANYEG